MKPSDLEAPTKHPWGMLDGLNIKHSFENERFFAWMLVECQKAGDWIALKTPESHPDLVEKGLLEQVNDIFHYRLTTKAKGLLFSQYGKPSDEKEAS